MAMALEAGRALFLFFRVVFAVYSICFWPFLHFWVGHFSVVCICLPVLHCFCGFAEGHVERFNEFERF